MLLKTIRSLSWLRLLPATPADGHLGVDGEEEGEESREPSGFFRGFHALGDKRKSNQALKEKQHPAGSDSSSPRARPGATAGAGQPESSAGSAAGPKFGEPGYIGFGSVIGVSGDSETAAVGGHAGGGLLLDEELQDKRQQQGGLGNSRGLY